MSLYLYHATDKNNLDSIMSKGLLKNPGKHNWEGMYTDDGVYLAFDADVAESYAETADVESDEIVILKIPLDKLDQDYIEYDWNNRCEYVDDINSCVYRKDIPPTCISVTTSDKEPSQDIHDFEGTDMYEWILQTFDEEVETNEEVWGERMNSFMKLTINEGTKRNKLIVRKRLRENTNTENKMIITVGSSLNADGFDIVIIDQDMKKLFKNSYHYGYNASWKKTWADNDKPYVTNIIKDLCDRYGVTKDNIEVTAGKNVFTGSNVNDKAVDRFIKNYIEENLKRKQIYDECLEESNVLGMGGGWPNLYLPKDAKQYLSGNGFERVNTELGPCFYMRFTGNEVWEIYVTEEDGAIYVVQEGHDIKPTDSLTLIDDRDYRDDINALINLGNCLSNGEDFDYCIDAFFRGDLHTESINYRNKYFKEDLESGIYHDAQKAVYDFFMKKQWDLNNPEVANYVEAVAEQLELDPEFATGEYTMRDWYKDTYWSYPEEIEWLDSTAY